VRFTIYSDQPSFFTVDEVALLLSLSENLSFAIAAFEVDKERRLQWTLSER